MKTSVFLVENSLATLMVMLMHHQSSHFNHKIHSNALPLREVVIGGNGNL